MCANGFERFSCTMDGCLGRDRSCNEILCGITTSSLRAQTVTRLCICSDHNHLNQTSSEIQWTWYSIPMETWRTNSLLALYSDIFYTRMWSNTLCFEGISQKSWLYIAAAPYSFPASANTCSTYWNVSGDWRVFQIRHTTKEKLQNLSLTSSMCDLQYHR